MQTMTIRLNIQIDYKVNLDDYGVKTVEEAIEIDKENLRNGNLDIDILLDSYPNKITFSIPPIT